LGIALGFAPPGSGQPEPLLCDVAVRSHELDYANFEAGAALRLPGVRLREATGQPDAGCVGRLHGYVELRPAVALGAWELSLISSDGRAWFRTITVESDQAARALASALANLVAAIEDASAEPDELDVALPVEFEDPEPPVPDPEPDPEPERSELPTPSEAVVDEPGPIRLEIGPRLTGAAVFGLAPGPGVRGAGGGLGVDLRLPDGLAFGLDVRALTSSAAALTLVRMRVALGVGWVARNGIFEVPILVSGIIEPWFVRAGESARPLGQPPMIGGGARVAPGVVLPLGSLQIRVGLLLGFEIAVEAARGGLTPALALDPASDPILRAGGVELSAGLELGVWVPVRERR